jgi:hypothetical protein
MPNVQAKIRKSLALQSIDSDAGGALTKGDKRVGPLNTIPEIQTEMGRVYRMARTGKISIDEACRYAYMLDRMISAARAVVVSEKKRGVTGTPFVGLTIVTPVGSADA